MNTLMGYVITAGLLIFSVSGFSAETSGQEKNPKTKKGEVYRIDFPVSEHQLDINFPLQATQEEILTRDQKPTDLKKD